MNEERDSHNYATMYAVSSTRSWVRAVSGGVVLVCVVVLCYHTTQGPATPTHAPLNTPKTLANKYDVWPPFSPKPRHKWEWYVSECFEGRFSEDVEVALGTQLDTWARATHPDCQGLYRTFTQLYEVHDRYSKRLHVPDKFQAQVNKWLGGDKALIEQVHHQHLIHVFHPLTAEHTVYNPVRAKRPMPTRGTDMFKWVEELSRNTSQDCDFCQYKDMTAVDEFGRAETHDTARVTNTFKVEAWHSMVVTRHLHHPLNFTRGLMRRFFQEAITWVYQVAKKDPKYIYTNIAWDTLHHAGASQIHPHLHMMVSPDHYYGHFELMRMAAQRYVAATGENYWGAVLEVHQALGLVVAWGDAVAFPILTGKADLEVVILSDFPSDSFYDLVFFAMSAYHDSFTQLCKSFAAAWPQLGTSKRAFQGRMPAVARLISRGDCTSLRTDYSTYEIFQIVYRIHDPWQVAAALRAAVTKHGGEGN